MHRPAPLFLACILLGIEAWAQSPQAIRDVLSRVVLVTALDENGKPMAIGSGFVVDAEGRIASNLHVIAGATSATVRFVNQTEKFTVRTVSALNSSNDLVVLRIDKQVSPLGFGDSSRSQIGDRVLAFGNPEGLEGTVSEGIVSAMRKLGRESHFIQITAAISPGSSGGPVVDRDGKVIGLASASVVSGQNLNFAIPIEYLRPLLTNKFKEMPMAELQQRADVRSGSSPFQDKTLSQVKALDFGYTYWTTDATDVRFSVQNNLDRDIKYVRILVVWKRGKEKLDYSAYMVHETIPAGQALQIRKKDHGGVSRFISESSARNGFTYEARVLDYEILPTSGELKFK